AATKDRLLSQWEALRFLHFASHVVRDPDDPYLTFIPLASDAARNPHASRLDLLDIRSADLSRCDLLVLSAWAAGSRVALSPSYAVPSLATAFSDAGARAVVHTLWNVREETAREFTTRFADAALGEGRPPLAALSRVSRQLASGPRGLR